MRGSRPEPGPLAPDEPAGRRHRVDAGLLLRVVRLVQVAQHLLVPERPAGRAALAQPAVGQRAHLVDEAGRPHGVHPPRDRARPARPDPGRRRAGPSRSTGWAAAARPGTGRRSARAPPAPARSGGRCWAGSAPAAAGSRARQPVVQGLRADPGQLVLQPRRAAPHPYRGSRTAPAPPARTGRTRRPAAGCGRGRRCRRSPPGRLAWYSATLAGSVTSHRSSTWCGTPSPLGRGQLGGADVHAPVELHRVGVDHLAVERVGQGQAERGLAGRGRPDHRDNLRRSIMRLDVHDRRDHDDSLMIATK